MPRGPIPHRRFKEGLRLISDLHFSVTSYQTSDAILVTGPSGCGKSTLLEDYKGRFPSEKQQGGDKIPVVVVVVPSVPTSKILAEAILLALGYPKAHRGGAAQKTPVIIDLFKKCGVELLILDEFQHLFYAPSVVHFRDVTDWLKTLISKSDVGVVGCGLPEAESVVDANEQLRRRFSARYRLTPFTQEGEDFAEFRAVLKSLQSQLPIPTHEPLYEANVARRMLVASYGLLDYVSKILEGAVEVCHRSGQHSIDLPSLAEGFRRRVWRDVPERLNPFHPESYLRAMDRPGEIFYLHVSHDHVGSAIARRIRLNGLKGGGQ